MRKSIPHTDELLYSDFQIAAFWQLLFALLVTSSLGVAYGSAVSAIAGWALGLFLSGFGIWWWLSKAIRIQVTAEHLIVGNFKIEREHIGKVRDFSSDSFLNRIRGEAHRQDLFVLRNLSKGGVEIEINDSKDPFCHWVITAKRPSRLTSTLASGK